MQQTQAAVKAPFGSMIEHDNMHVAGSWRVGDLGHVRMLSDPVQHALQRFRETLCWLIGIDIAYLQPHAWLVCSDILGTSHQLKSRADALLLARYLILKSVPEMANTPPCQGFPLSLLCTFEQSLHMTYQLCRIAVCMLA